MDVLSAVLGITVAIALLFRDRRQINDRTLRLVERDLDLEELRMEG